MRRLSMKNKRRKSETSDASEEYGVAHADSSNSDNETHTGKNNNDTPVMRKSASKRRSLRSSPGQKSAVHTNVDIEAKDDSTTELEEEQETDEKTAIQKSTPIKRRKKEDTKASTSVRDKRNDEDEYEVDKLVNTRTIKGRRQFLVRWKGYGESADSWENEKDLNCPKLIEEYLDEEKEKDVKFQKTGLTKPDKPKKLRGTPKKQIEDEEQNGKGDKDKESSKEFEVEKIIEVRFKKNGTRQFLIRWKGFSPVDDTWEPEKNLNCPELISKFMQKVEKAKIADIRELRMNRVHTKRYTLSTHESGRRLSKRNKNKQRPTYHECDE